MKMRRIDYLLVAVMTLLASCTKESSDEGSGSEPNPESQQLSFSIESMSFSMAEGSGTFTISSNMSWTITSDQLWCMVSPSSGSGNGTITVNVSENTSTDSRSATITVKAGSTVQTIPITQDGLTSLDQSTRTFTINGVSFKMILVEGGTFKMGATSDQGIVIYGDEEPTHDVTLSYYYIGETEVTQELWKAVTDINLSNFSGLRRPVETVSWNDCQYFITRLNSLTGQNFRLPTEAEWEFAARGGNNSGCYMYAGSNSLDDVAWYWDNSRRETHEVAQKAPNELGLYDMSGNVYEWCQDWYGSYSSSSQTNPTGPSSGSDRVSRGSCWDSYASECRLSIRHSYSPNNKGKHLGLRLVLPIEEGDDVLDGIVRVDKNSLSFTAAEGSDTFTVNSNTRWSVTSDQAWCTVDPSSGSGNGSIVVNVLENTSTESRSATITVKAGITKTISVTQVGAAPANQSVRTFTINGVSFNMILVEGGSFTMGATSEQGDDVWATPTHRVTLSYYYIGETEVTQDLWQAVMGNNPSYYKESRHPVECVSWKKCQDFVTQLNALIGENFRLPTEAEWEFAARGGNNSKGYRYSGSNNIDEVAWYEDNITGKTFTYYVAKKSPNELGLYDMSGNVYEWCQDWDGSYSSSSQTNPTGPASGDYRVIRGGCWNTSERCCRVAYRWRERPSNYDYDIGLRLAL